MTKAITMVVAPLNIIQKDQIVTLRNKNISCCKLDIKGRGRYLTDSSENEEDFGYERVNT
jgi:hypothetical protein